jgi:hypothetical protein
MLARWLEGPLADIGVDLETASRVHIPDNVRPSPPKRRPSSPFISKNPMCRRAGAVTVMLIVSSSAMSRSLLSFKLEIVIHNFTY